MVHVTRLFGAVAAAALLQAGPALAGDRQLQRVASGAEAVIAAARAAGASTGGVQRAYDRGRDLQEAVRRSRPVSASCVSLAGWTARVADAAVALAEGYDRLDAVRVARARRALSSAAARLPAARAACRPSTAASAAETPPLVDPRPGAASFGEVSARAGVAVDRAELIVDGHVAGPLAVGADGTARARVIAAPGRHDLRVRFVRRGAVVAQAASAGVWLLPDSARVRVAAAELDPTLQRALRSAAAGFDGVSGIWVHDLASGRAGSWNAGARFAAASTVKLGVMVEAARRSGDAPETASTAHEVAAIGGWSSNLAVNRLLPRIGGSAAAAGALRRMGATSSTFTGGYQVATERPPVTVVAQPPAVSRRVTTAADLGAVMVTIHRAARGDVAALRATGMSRAQARFVLGTLLAGERDGDNRGLLIDALGESAIAAQKHGWISSARHTAAVVYTARGPMVIVVVTGRPGVTRRQAARLGAAVVRAAVTAQAQG